MDDTAFYFWWDGGFESVHNRKIKLSTQMKPRMLPQRNIDLIFQDEMGYQWTGSVSSCGGAPGTPSARTGNTARHAGGGHN